MNKSQITLYRLEKKYKKILNLKARQLWISTYKLISGLDKATWYRNQNVVITAHTQKKQTDLFKIVKYAYRQIPSEIKLADWTIWRKPIPKYDSKTEFYFEALNSTIKVELDSRSGTSTDSHITELAFRPDAEEMMTGTLPAIPADANLTVETTANWIGNYFYRLWKQYEGVEPTTSEDFKTVFFPRYTDEWYALDIPPDEKWELPDFLKHIHKIEYEGNPLTEEQKFRYFKKRQLHGNMVVQEYPSTPDEAFITSGNTVFDVNIIRNMGELDYKVDEVFRDLRIYMPANEKRTHWYGVDTALWWSDWDFASISVRDKYYNLMACFYGKIPPDELCQVIDRLYTHYWYKGIIGIERNNTGIATLTKAKEYVWYHRIYAEKTVDKKTNKKTKRYGWNTNTKTRPLMISDYEEAIRNGDILEMDERTKVEAYWFIYDEKYRPAAQEWSHDDSIIADCIALQMVKHEKYIQIV